MATDGSQFSRQREIADIFRVPPWLVGPEIPRTKRERMRWQFNRLRWFVRGWVRW